MTGCGLVDDDGATDEGCSCSPGTTQPCFVGDPALAGHGPCAAGTQSCNGDGEFGEWGDCSAALGPSVTGTLLCSSTPGAPLDATNCPINKPEKYYPATSAGCP